MDARFTEVRRPAVVAAALSLLSLAWMPALHATGPYEAWKAANFTSAELLDPTISGDNADPDGDGRVNILEYALGSNPHVSDAKSVNEPMGTVIDGKLTIAYTRNVAAEDLIYFVEVSSDLATWTYGSSSVAFVAETGNDLFRTVLIADLTSSLPTVPHFIRLRIQANPQTDSDFDGLPDWWEIQYFGNLSKDGSWLGPSGLSNLLAYRRGVNPLVSTIADAGSSATALVVFTPLQQ